jgi:cytochrome P450
MTSTSTSIKGSLLRSFSEWYNTNILTYDECVANLMFIIAAGHATTASLLSSSLLELLGGHCYPASSHDDAAAATTATATTTSIKDNKSEWSSISSESWSNTMSHELARTTSSVQRLYRQVTHPTNVDKRGILLY